MDKKTLREKNKLLRKKLNIEEISDRIISKIKTFDVFLNSKNVLIFYPMKHEINLLDLLSFEDKNFFLPKVIGNDLIICPYTNNLAKSNFGVMEPDDNIIFDVSKIDIAFIPSLSIDKNLNRIGYGKGYYDRLFKNPNFKATKIATLPRKLLVDRIDSDSFDVPVDFVITD